MDAEAQVRKFMMERNFLSNLKGYNYAKQSIMASIENSGMETSKIIFITVAEKFNTTNANVERCMRTFVDRMWERAGLFDKKPTPREFINKCAEHVMMSAPSHSAYDVLYD